MIVVRWLAWWALLGALWLAVDDTVALPELVTGAVAAALGATAAEVVHAQGVVSARLRLRWLSGAWRVPVAVVRDLVVLTVALGPALVRPGSVRGAFRSVEFDAGDPDDPHDTGRRALAKGAGSFAPSTYVIGIDDDHDTMLVHQLRSSAGPRAADPLELA